MDNPQDFSKWSLTQLTKYIQQLIKSQTPRSLTSLSVDDLTVHNSLTDLSNDSGWVPPTLLNSWVQQTSRVAVGYRKIGKVVYLRGSMFGGVSGSTVFVLRPGFRPSGVLLPPGGAYPPGESCTVVVDNLGNLTIYFTSATQISIDGLSFLID